MRLLLAITSLLFISSASAAGSMDDPILTMIRLDKLEITDIGDNNDSAWDLQGWVGKDLNKFWFKSEGERVNGSVEGAELQFLYSHAVAPFWDMQIGWRHDIKPTPSREWLALGIQGLAPYFFETDIALFIGERGNVGLRTTFDYEVMLTQKWVLSPEFEVNAYSKDDRAVGVGSGLSDINAGLRLRYEIKRELAPYVGIEWTRQFGNTADFSEQAGDRTSQAHWVLGIKAWF